MTQNGERSGLTLGQIHSASVRRERAGTLVVVGVQLCVDDLRTLPLALVVLRRDKDVGILRAGDATIFVAFGLVARRGEEQLVVILAVQHGRVVCPSRVEQVFALHGIVRPGFLPRRSLLG